MQVYNFPQRSEEWYNVRLAKFTGSDFHTFMGNSETKKRLLLEKTAEKITGKSEQREISNADIERGKALEDIARLNYELETGNNVEEVGFIEESEYVGCSPDGLVGDDGMIEIKCPKSSVFLKHLLEDSIEPVYYTQMQFNLMVSGRKWCDFIKYNENFTLYVKRIMADEEYQKKIREKLDECIEIVKNNIEQYKKGVKNV